MSLLRLVQRHGIARGFGHGGYSHVETQAKTHDLAQGAAGGAHPVTKRMKRSWGFFGLAF